MCHRTRASAVPVVPESEGYLCYPILKFCVKSIIDVIVLYFYYPMTFFLTT